MALTYDPRDPFLYRRAIRPRVRRRSLRLSGAVLLQEEHQLLLRHPFPILAEFLYRQLASGSQRGQEEGCIVL
jgi:hypothetical protein